MRVGVKILDDAKFRKTLEDGFARFGYSLANSDVDQQLYCTHYSHLTPRVSGRAYLLKFTRPPDGDWDTTTLIEASTNQPLKRCVLHHRVSSGERSQPHSDVDNVYFRWVEQILETFAHEIKLG